MCISFAFVLALSLLTSAATLRAEDELKVKDDRDFTNPFMVTSYLEAHYPTPASWKMKYVCVKEAKGLVLTVNAEGIDSASYAETVYMSLCRYIGHCLHYRAPINTAHFRFGPVTIQAPLAECLLIARAKTADETTLAYKKFRAAYDWNVVTVGYRNKLRQTLVEQQKILKHEVGSLGYLELEMFEIARIIDRNCAVIVSVEKDKPSITYWLKNFPTHKYSEGDAVQFDYTKQQFRYSGTTDYTPKFGAKRLLHMIEFVE